ncbi:MAG: hypothetical protein KFB96_13485 [Thiocapsa sp.]|uniref:hypothetical protein n=1 Tax=Thiocapsa sp. TaxID=2024551 RepID=UPI001BCF0280|nr:hypothetical protein [Thiocapsa sp.]QVL46777.1 MAG: hypothetical protein KFB96_13485 [Thiocapsa sp.]
MRTRLSIAVMLAWMTPSAAPALEFVEGKLQVHGFASQAVLKSTDNAYYGNSPGTSFDFTEIGLNASYQSTPNLLFSGQLLVRRAGEMYDGTPSLDYGLVDFTPISDAERRLGVRLGRIKNPFGLYNETRDVPFTRPSIFLPQVIYYDKVRNALLSYDGIMFYGDRYLDQGNLSLNLGVGQSVIDNNVEWAYLGGDFEGDLRAEGINWGIGSLWFSTPADEVKLGLSAILTEMNFNAAPDSILTSGTIDVYDWVASFQFNSEDWTVSAEYSRAPTHWNDLGPYFPFEDQVMEGYYLQGAYRLRPNLEIMTRYEEGFANRKDRDGRDFSDLTGGSTPRFDFFSKIWTTGLRWDINPNIMFRLEFQRHDGTYALSIRENPESGDLVREWDVFAASISVRF